MLSLSKHPGFAEALSEVEGEVEGKAEGATQYRAGRPILRDQESGGAVWDTLRSTLRFSGGALSAVRCSRLLGSPWIGRSAALALQQLERLEHFMHPVSFFASSAKTNEVAPDDDEYFILR